jgi:ligand-binding sensor domain-containing protein
VNQKISQLLLPYLFGLLNMAGSFAQPFVSRIYTANDGLPDAYTLGIYQDRQGYLWVGTYTGLSRFDGRRFSTVEVKSTSGALSANVLLEDHLGRLWINYRKSVCLLNKDSVQYFPASDNRTMEYVFGAIEFKDHTIWALANQGAYEMDGHQWKKVEFPKPFEGLNCRQVIETPQGLYINFEKYIAFKKGNSDFEIISPPVEESFYINIQKSGDAIYANRVNGLIEINNGEVHELFKDQLSQTINYNFIIDSRKRFWISTEKSGILVSDPGDKAHLDYTISLPFNLSTFLYEDRDHNIWATNYEGLIKISDVAFHRFDRSDEGVYENIRCLSSDDKGNVYFASLGKGVFKLDAVNGKLIPFSSGNFHDLTNDVVDGMCFDADQALWMITRKQKLIRYKNQIASELTSLLPPAARGFEAIRFDRHLNKIILASDKLYIGDENGFISWGQYFKTTEIFQPRFVCVRNNGDIVLATTDNRVLLVSQNKDVIDISTQLDVNDNSKEIKIYEDPNGGIWVTKTGEGLARYEENTNGKFGLKANITTRDGLPNNTIISLVFDSRKRLWMTTLSGIAMITSSGNPGDFQYSVHRIGEELGSTVLNWGASGYNIVCDLKDNIWVSTFHELIRFDASKIKPARTVPGISIEHISLNLKETNWENYSDSVAGYFGIPYKPVLDYSANSLGITYQGISFSENPGLTYSYLLTGKKSGEIPDSLDPLWSEPTPSNDVSFVKLPPGHYLFAVKAKEAGSLWSRPATFYFTIKPPFWMTWWFTLLALILVAIIILALIRFRIKRIQKKAEVQHLLNELEMKALKAQMNPHFIYNALNSIQSLVMDGKQQESVRYMSKFAKLLRQVLEHSGTNLVTLDKELQTINLYVELEMLRLNVELDYQVVLDDQILAEKEWVPPLILQPFVENALWHGLSRKEGEKKLQIEIQADDDWLFITVTDNGIGRQKAAELKAGLLEYPRSMGMEITGKRLQAVNAENVSAMKILDLNDSIGHTTGTQVWIKLKRQISN